jgi:pilus assembly protein CpaB
LFGLALFFGLAAAFTARDLLKGETTSAAATELKTTPVVVARMDIPTGAPLLAHQLDTIDWPSDYVPPGSFPDADRLKTRVPRRKLRAVSVKVDPVIGVAGFVRPGARVDVLATLRRIDLNAKLPYSKVILQDVEVLAIDQKMETASDGEAELVSVVTLQVTPKQAEHLIYSAHEGRLQLALRNPGDREIVKTAAVGVADLLGSRKRTRSKPSSRTRVEVLKGSSVHVKTF